MTLVSAPAAVHQGPNPVEIRSYAPASDRAGIIQLWRMVFGYNEAHNDPTLALDKKLAVDDGLLFVAVASATVVGSAMAGYDGHRGWLYSVAVHPDWRRHGLGRGLVARAEAALAERGCLKINLQLLASNADTARFYESLGYAIEPRLSMGKRVAQNIPRTPG